MCGGDGGGFVFFLTAEVYLEGFDLRVCVLARSFSYINIRILLHLFTRRRGSGN